MTDQPVLLLDVDGVLNAVARHGDPDVWPAAAWKVGMANANAGRDDVPEANFRIVWAQPVIDFLIEMHERVEIRWHTTWQHAAQLDLAQMLGLPEFPVADAPEFKNRYSWVWWKIGAAERVVFEEKRPLIWTDDDINYASSDAVKHIIRAKDVLAISPLTHIGLTPKALTAIREFVDAH